MQALIQQLRAAVGEANVLLDDLATYEQDWRQRNRGKAMAVVRPGNTEETAAVVRAVAAAKAAGMQVSLVPQGGNTGLVMGSTPDNSGTEIVLSMTRMQRVRQIDGDNLTITVEAGCILQNLQKAASDAGYLFPLSLAAEGSCTIGGNLGTNAGGTQVLRYGNTRELCLGLEVVTAQGQVWSGLTGLRKDNTGYDLRNLMVGSEGTLGIITAATMKLYPLPAATLTAWAPVASMAAAVKLLGLAQQKLASGLTGFEVMGHLGISLVAKHFPQIRIPMWPGTSKDAPFCVLMEASDAEGEAHARERFEHLMEAALEQEIIADAVVAESMAQAQSIWHIRESITMAQSMEGMNIKHDISLPVSCMVEFCDKTEQLLAKEIPGVRLVNFGHLGDGNLHFNVQCPEGADAKAFLEKYEHIVNILVYDSVRSFGGSISAEHGIGAMKVAELPHYKSPVAMEMMRAVKNALDPLGVLNPGRVLVA
jgi:FAD/FMN-containing dehydrogenase